MSLNTLVNYISNSQITSELIKRISKNNELNIIGSSRYAKSIILDSIAKKEEKNILLICPNVEIAYKWIGYFESINDKAVLYYPPTEHLPYSSINKSKEIEFSQLTVLSKLIKKEKNQLNIVISTERSLQPHLINRNILIENKLDLQKGVQIEIQELANKLTLLGYTKDNVTSTEGFWSRRGEIIDIYPVNNEFPIRLEFFDNVIEKIREYDPHTQKTLESTNNIEIIQAGVDLLIKDKLNNLSKNSIFNSEDINKNNLDRYLGIIEKEPSNIIDFINKETILVIDELEDCKKFANNWYLDSENNFDNCEFELNEKLKNNEIIGYGQNRTIERNSVFAHAEIEAIKMASQKVQNYRLIGCDIYSTIEPCHLCAKAIVASRMDNLFIGAKEPKEGSIVSQDNFLDKPFHNHKIHYEIGILENECKEIIQRFFKAKR